MAQKGGGGFGSKILRGLGFLVIIGLGLAILKIFNYDPFGFVDWLLSTAWNIIQKISNWFASNETFQKIFSQQH